jgi:hypothetical protein
LSLLPVRLGLSALKVHSTKCFLEQKGYCLGLLGPLREALKVSFWISLFSPAKDAMKRRIDVIELALRASRNFVEFYR